MPAALPAPLYLNLWLHRPGTVARAQADLFTDRDEAACDAASPSLHHYAGTVVIAPDAPPCLADLSAHGAAVLAERAAERAEETALARSLCLGAGRVVL